MSGDNAPNPLLSVGVNWMAYARTLTADNLERVVLDAAGSAKGAGFDGVELPLPLAEHLFEKFGDEFWSRIGEQIRAMGLRTHSVHGPTYPVLGTEPDQAAATMARYARLCIALGVDVMVVHPTPHSHPHVCVHVPRLMEQDVTLSRVVSDVFGDSGVRLAVENLPTYGVRYLAALMDRLEDRPNVGVCFDTGHWNVRPELGLVEAVSLLSGRIEHLHLNDNHGWCDEHLPPGRGAFDWRRFVGAVPQHMNARPWMVELSTPVLSARADAATEDGRLLTEACGMARMTLAEARGKG